MGKKKDVFEKLGHILLGVKPNEFALLKGMANYESFDSKGWLEMTPILKAGKFKSQKNNFPKYCNALIKKGLVECKKEQRTDKRKRLVGKNEFRLKRNKESFERLFAIFYREGNMTNRFLHYNYFRDAHYFMNFLDSELKIDINNENLEKLRHTGIFAKLYFYSISNPQIFQKVRSTFATLLLRENINQEDFFSAFTMPFAFVSLFETLIQETAVWNIAKGKAKNDCERMIENSEKDLHIVIKELKNTYQNGGKKLKKQTGD